MEKRCFIFLIGVLIGDIVQSTVVKVKLFQTLPLTVTNDYVESENADWNGEGDESIGVGNIYQMRFKDPALYTLISDHCKMKGHQERTGAVAAFIDGEWEFLDSFTLETHLFTDTTGEKVLGGTSGEKPKEQEQKLAQEKTDQSNQFLFFITYLNRTRVNTDYISNRVSWPLKPIEKIGLPHFFKIRLYNIRETFSKQKIRRLSAIDRVDQRIAPRQHYDFYENPGTQLSEQTYEIGKMARRIEAFFDLVNKYNLKRLNITDPANINPGECCENEKYTFVVSDDAIRFSQTGAHATLNRVSKHNIHAHTAMEVYCAGEFYVENKGGTSILHLLNNSGGFQPGPEPMEKLKKLMERNFGFGDTNIVVNLTNGEPNNNAKLAVQAK